MLLRKFGREREAARLLQETAQLDPTDFWARYLIGSSLPSDNRLLLDLALDCARAGFYAEAITILKAADRQVNEIGRASCRERVEGWGGAVSVKKKRGRDRGETRSEK